MVGIRAGEDYKLLWRVSVCSHVLCYAVVVAWRVACSCGRDVDSE